MTQPARTFLPYGTILRACVAGLLLCLLAACGAKVELLADVPETEANEVMSALLDAGIKATKIPGKEGMVSLTVEQAQVGKAFTSLRTEGLPRERYARMGDVFRKEGLISSPLEERARYLWALSQELGATISQIDGVIKARVHVVLPERSNGSDPAMPSSAAVFIKYRRGYNMDDAIPQIRRLVANSIPGLVPDKVTVVPLAAMPKPSGDAGQAGGGARVLGYAVSSEAAAGLWPVIWALLALLLISVGGGAWLAWRIWGEAARRHLSGVQPARSVAAEL
jgi:type III secretion protein J